MVEQVRMPLTPGLETPEGQQRANAALERRNHADYGCYQLLDMLVDGQFIDWNAVERDRKGTHKDVKETLAKRREANDEFIKAMAGHE